MCIRDSLRGGFPSALGPSNPVQKNDFLGTFGDPIRNWRSASLRIGCPQDRWYLAPRGPWVPQEKLLAARSSPGTCCCHLQSVDPEVVGRAVRRDRAS
eukprot:3177620-Prymnesium_polylepis.1